MLYDKCVHIIVQLEEKLWHPYNQGSGARIKISVSSSRHLKFLTLAPEQFGTLKTENHCIMCTVGLFKKLSVERELKFPAPALPCKNF